MIKLSDYVMNFLAERGITDIYLVSGGGIMHLLDSVGRHPRLRYVCNHHEQASAICAEAHARVTGRIAACLVTTGPGATNGLSGIAGAWFDSIPVIALSGQVRRPLIADYSKLRQFGPQEVNIVALAKPVTKYAKTIMEPESVRCELERAFSLATSGRPGPVWLDFPLDVQAAMIDEVGLRPLPTAELPPPPDAVAAREGAARAFDLLLRARRPLAICGSGVHLGGAQDRLRSLVKALGIPVVVTIGAMDLFDDRDPLFMGRFGPVGQRRANFALQNADLLLGLGASFSIASIGFNFEGFAPKATKIMVNIDPGELGKATVVPHLAIAADIGAFAGALLGLAAGRPLPVSPRWPVACEQWKRRYPPITPDYREDEEHVHSHILADVLSDLLVPDDVVTAGNSLDIVSLYQAFRVTLGQRVFTNINYGAMGWDLPGAIGACVGHGRRRTVLVTGDGSIQLNLQELQTIKDNRLPIKIFVYSNRGYQSIRATQEAFFDGFYVGSDEGSGVSCPPFDRLAAVYDFPFARARTNDEIREAVVRTLAADGPALCEVMLSPKQERKPRVRSFRRDDGTLESRPLEDMYPFLPREEVHENMHLFDGDAP